MPPPPQPTYYGRPRAPGDGRATTAFVLGLLSVIVVPCLSILGPFAWSIGASERRRAVEAGYEPEGLATAGYVLGIIGTILLVLGGLWLLFALVVMAGGMASMH
jgi:hypothetical protein